MAPADGRAEKVPAIFTSSPEIDRVQAVARSYALLTGKSLGPEGEALLPAMWNAPRAILAHDTGTDPVFFFANRYALQAFGYDLETMLRTPSRLSAEAPLREERQRLLDRVTAQGFIDDYAGVRVKANGERFRIERATVWNVTDTNGLRLGQAATFIL